MKYLHYITLLLFSGGLIITSCEKDTDPPIGVSTETVEVHINNRWEYGPFELNTGYNHPITGDLLTFDTLKYYISNVRLKNADGSWWTHPNSYFLVDLENPASSVLTLTDVPYGVYTSISYMVGIDSTKQQSGSGFTGALSPTNKMFLSADSGFVMLKAFGVSPDAPAPGVFAYYLHGHEAPKAIMKERLHGFGAITPMVISKPGDYRVYVHNYINSIWQSIGSVATTPTIAYSGDDAMQVAGDFFTSFNFDSIKQ